jgi:outer membrane protein
MRTRTFCIAFCFVSLAGFGQISKKQWDLPECISYARKNNITIRHALAQQDMAKAELKQAKGNALPSLTVVTNLNDQSGRSLDPTTYTFTVLQLLTQNVQVGGSLLLYNFGKNKHLIAAQQKNVEALGQEIEGQFQDVKVNLIKAYIDVLTAQENMQAVKIAYTQTQKQYEFTRLQAQAGASSELNRLQLGGKLFSDSSGLIIALDNYNFSVQNIKALMNLPAEEDFQIADSLALLSAMEYINTILPAAIFADAQKKLARFKSDSLKIESAKASLRATKSAVLPSLTFGYNLASAFSNYLNGKSFGDWWYNYPLKISNNFNQQVNIGVTIPIGNNYRFKTAKEQSEINIRDLQYTQQFNTAQLKRDIYAAYNNATSTVSRLSNAIKTLDYNNLAYRIVLDSYNAGGMKAIDLITVDNALAKARTEMLSIKYELILRSMILRFYAGEI